MNRKFFYISKRIRPLKCDELFYIISGIICITGSWRLLIDMYFNRLIYNVFGYNIANVIEPLMSISIFLSHSFTSIVFSIVFSIFILHVKINIKLNTITLYLSFIFLVSLGILTFFDFDLHSYENIFNIYIKVVIIFIITLIVLMSKNFMFNILFTYLFLFSYFMIYSIDSLMDKGEYNLFIVTHNIYTTYGCIYKGACKIYIDNNLLHFDNGKNHMTLPMNSVQRIESSIEFDSKKKGLKK